MRFPQHDPGDEHQAALFDARATQARLCTACNTTRTSLCRFDADRAHEIGDPRAKRPRTCLNSGQLRADQELPY